MTYAMLLQCLVEAEQRVNSYWPADVKARSQETIDIIHQRLAIEGLNRKQLEKIVRDEASNAKA
jgi:hypothetical protein